MPAMNLTNESKRTRVVNSTAAGVTQIFGSVIDTEGFESTVFEVCFGALSATQVTKIHAQGGTLANGTDMADLAGTSTGPMLDTQSNFMLVLEVERLAGFRYIRLSIDRGTANAVIDSAVAVQYRVRRLPTAGGDDVNTVSAKKLVQSPALGAP